MHWKYATFYLITNFCLNLINYMFKNYPTQSAKIKFTLLGVICKGYVEIKRLFSIACL